MFLDVFLQEKSIQLGLGDKESGLGALLPKQQVSVVEREYSSRLANVLGS